MTRASEPIGKLLEGWLAEQHKQTSVLFEIQQAWSKIVGHKLAAHTRPVSIRKGKLVVHVDRPGENYELSFERERVASRIKKIAGDKILTIVVRAGKI